MSVAARLATEDPAVVFAAIRRGVRRSVTKQARAYRPLQQEAGEKCGLRKVSGATRQRAGSFGEGTSHKMDPPVGGNVEHRTFNIQRRTMGTKNAHSTSDLFHFGVGSSEFAPSRGERMLVHLGTALDTGWRCSEFKFRVRNPAAERDHHGRNLDRRSSR